MDPLYVCTEMCWKQSFLRLHKAALQLNDIKLYNICVHNCFSISYNIISDENKLESECDLEVVKLSALSK
jgi:hypothetical protein